MKCLFDTRTIVTYWIKAGCEFLKLRLKKVFIKNIFHSSCNSEWQ